MPVSSQFTAVGFSHNMSMGIVGLPNIGKSTLFNEITQSEASAQNYPFCTIDPNNGVVVVPDRRLTELAAIYKPKRVVNAHLQVTDIAGLVKGASSGEGLGNRFLDHISHVDGIFHVVRCFEDADIVRTEEINPVADACVVNDEIRLKDLQRAEGFIAKYSRSLDKNLKDKLEATQMCADVLRSGKWLNEVEWDPNRAKQIAQLNFLTTKNVIYVANVGGDEYLSLKNARDSPGGDRTVKISKHLRAVMKSLKPVIVVTKGHVDISSAVKGAYDALNLITFYTCGRDEVRAWTIRKGTPGKLAGGVIHSDFVNNFISVDVMRSSDVIELGSEADVKKQAKFHNRGADYVVCDGDILHFKAGTGGKSKKKK